NGRWLDVRSAHVNGYIHSNASVPATAKAFRTWAGTVIAAAALARGDLDGRFGSERGRRRQLSAAVKATSELLGNTPAVTRASYIHPGVIEAWAEGRTVADAVAAERAETLHRLWLAPAVQTAVHDLLAACTAG
ncbi:MAG TPA: hypothetical protein VEL73_06090, partial [Mycobacteriales bacterium]|nr:hypothetical protein [Mycobacteriales bacterium]